MRGRPIILHLLICLFYPLQYDIISLTGLKTTKAIHPLLAFCKNATLLFNPRILIFRFIYEQIPNRIRIRIFGIFVLALLETASILALSESYWIFVDISSEMVYYGYRNVVKYSNPQSSVICGCIKHKLNLNKDEAYQPLYKHLNFWKASSSL